jgi:hypothetical protein
MLLEGRNKKQSNDIRGVGMRVRTHNSCHLCFKHVNISELHQKSSIMAFTFLEAEEPHSKSPFLSEDKVSDSETARFTRSKTWVTYIIIRLIFYMLMKMDAAGARMLELAQ